MVFKALDEKYKDVKQDEMHKALREYSYNVNTKPGETYRNFLVRLNSSQRKLSQHEIKLSEEVQGWFVLRKLRLDTMSEAMVLTATAGSLKVGDIIKALEALFPNGKGTGNKKDKEVFMADE